jgi:hypothetical protein
VGHWFSKGRIWACALAGELAMFAYGRRPYLERVPFRLLQQSLYNHVTGEVVLAPARDVRVDSLRVTPAEGYQFLAQIYKETSDA